MTINDSIMHNMVTDGVPTLTLHNTSANSKRFDPLLEKFFLGFFPSKSM